ncbi:MAG: class I adenylate-forming enzyme family protein [Acidimicrobiales bacterium]
MGLDLGADLKVERCQWQGTALLSYPDAPPTILDVLDRAVALHGERPFLIAPEGTVTYAEFARLVGDAATSLSDLGITPGDRFAVAAVNGLDIAVAIFAAAHVGAVMIGLNTKLATEQWAFMLTHSRVSVGLAQPEFRERLRDAARAAALATDRLHDLATVMRGGAHVGLPVARATADPARTYAVVYTSGTTGRPKASQVVHRCSVHSAMSYAHLLGLGPQDRTAVVFQLFYISAMHAHLLPMALVGGSCVLVPDASPASYLDVLAEQRITWAYTVPSMWLLLLRDPSFNAARLPHLRLAAFGGSPFPVAEIAELRRRLPSTRWYDVYGLSETHSPATMLLDHEFDAKPGSVGRPLPCMEATVVDDNGDQLPADTAGELWLRGSLVTTGYADDPGATAAAITDGWFHTGDIARIDAEGYVYIVDRKKDMITRGGHKIFSAEVEQVLRSHPQVLDAAVVGTPDPVAFEAVIGFVVALPEDRPTKKELRHLVRDRLADHAVPRHIHFVDELPRNATGKLEKETLRALALKAVQSPDQDEPSTSSRT